MSLQLTTQDINLFKAIKDYYAEQGFSPSYRELLKICNENSLSTVKKRLDRLESMGYITHKVGVARSIRVV
ncbi:LexA family protein [Fusibacter sp. JL216-2]|uniref:LexA family protein n=1 Tax=Fusibacter sp. JL216-2 TaxID=3071453 RepID=UPI003D3281AA